MGLKKVFKSWKDYEKHGGSHGQAVAEYILVFVAVAVGVLLVFRGVNPERITANNSISGAVNSATDYFVGWKNNTSNKW